MFAWSLHREHERGELTTVAQRMTPGLDQAFSKTCSTSFSPPNPFSPSFMNGTDLMAIRCKLITTSDAIAEFKTSWSPKQAVVDGPSACTQTGHDCRFDDTRCTALTPGLARRQHEHGKISRRAWLACAGVQARVTEELGCRSSCHHVSSCTALTPTPLNQAASPRGTYLHTLA